MMQSASTEELFKMSNEAKNQAGQAGAGNANYSAVPSNSSGQHNPRSWDNAMISEEPPPAYTPIRETGTIYTGKENTEALNVIQSLIDNGINPKDLSDAQSASLKNENSFIQHLSVEDYLKNRRQLDERTVDNNELPEGSSKKLSTYSHNVKKPVINSHLPSPSDRKQGSLSNSPPSSYHNPGSLPGLLGLHDTPSRSPQATSAAAFQGFPGEPSNPPKVTPAPFFELDENMQPEIHKEEDDDQPIQYGQITAHLQTGSADFQRRLLAYLTNHVAMTSALDQAITNSYAQQYPNALQSMHIQKMNPSPFTTPNVPPQQSPSSIGQPYFTVDEDGTTCEKINEGAEVNAQRGVKKGCLTCLRMCVGCGEFHVVMLQRTI